MKLVVGLDASSEKLDACFMADDSKLLVLKEATFENSQVDASQIKALILEFSRDFEIEKLVISMEATSLYSFHLSMFFKEDFELNQLNQLNLTVSVEQPTKLQKYCNIFEGHKNDRIDAFYNGNYFRIQRQVNPIVKEEKYLALQHLARTLVTS
ncbi:transposase [Enterococcus sp. DIV0421]